MNIAPSTYYDNLKPLVPGVETDITDRIEAICLEFPGINLCLYICQHKNS
jgi:hypothetical protein